MASAPPLPTRNTMDFFGAQDAARKRTGWLVFYLIICVTLMVAATYGAVWVCWMWGSTKSQIAAPDLFVPRLFFWVTGGTLLVIFGGAGFKMLQLSGGGAVVAEMLGGRLIPPNTRDPDERKLLNIVEEMAIAAGIHVPPVYVMEDERAINAFAAGHSPNTAVVSVTAGTLRMLSRDELQGVIGHEFSHILNGDMRLNLRLMGILFGILCIYTIGYILLRSSSSGYRRNYAENKKGGNPLPLFGILLMIIGGVGMLFAKLIKAAISRQREFLADASAVQFTRNPDGIANALKKIGGYSRESRIDNSSAEDASHLFFANGLGSAFMDAFATHPPLDERIRRIDPHFDGSFPKVEYPKEYAETDREEARRDGARILAVDRALGPAAAMALVGGRGGRVRLPEPRSAGRPDGSNIRPAVGSGEADQLDPETVLRQVGQLTPDQIAYAEDLMFRIPNPLLDMAHEPLGASAILYALLLDGTDAVRAAQVNYLRQRCNPAMNNEIGVAVKHLADLPVDIRLKLLDLLLPALRQLAPGQYQETKDVVQKLVDADQQLSLFEFMLIKLMRQHLDQHFGLVRPPVVQYYALKQLAPECEMLLTMVACAGAYGMGGSPAGAQPIVRAECKAAFAA
ncbi:MAG TPA: M48 family metallopeptidase, partial [Planctomycetota bacterium]|nr:M48 family metallopeptidase [Planctomycetota bacterium]